MNEDINNETDIIYKFLMIGDSNSRQASIFKKLSNDKYSYVNLFVDYQSLKYVIEVNENGKKIKKNTEIQLYGAAPLDRYRFLTKSYINNSNGIIIVYDITKRESFDNVSGWIKSIENYELDQMKTCMFLIGTQNDSDEEEGGKDRKVQTKKAEKLAEKYGVVWGGVCNVKTYTKNQYDEILIKFAQIVYNKFGYEKESIDYITFGKINNREKRKGCKS